MKNRITSNYIEGKSQGDKGYSQLLSRGLVSKGSSFARAYGAIEDLQHSIRCFVEFNPELVEKIDLEFFIWLDQALFALSSFIYCKAENTDYIGKYMFPIKAYTWLEDRIKVFKNFENKKLKSVGSEFILCKGYINKIRLKTRNVEQIFWNYRDQLKQISLEQDYLDSKPLLESQGAFLNRLSSYFYWLDRYEHCKKDDVTGNWISEMPEFKL